MGIWMEDKSEEQEERYGEADSVEKKMYDYVGG